MTETRLERPTPENIRTEEEGVALPEPTTPAIPMSLLALMTSEDAGADDRIWDWAQSKPPAPATQPARPEPPGPEAPEPEPPAPQPPAPEPPGPKPAGTEPTELAVVEGTELEPPADGSTQAPSSQATGAPSVAPATPETVEPEGSTKSDEVDLTGEDFASDAGLAAWGQQVRAATERRIRAPKGVDPAPVTSRIADRVASARRRESERRIGSARDLKKKIPLAPDLPPGLPAPPPIPLKEVEDKVAGALKKQLPQQVLPALVDYTYTPGTGKPQVFHPQVAALRLPEGSATVLTPVPPPAKGKREGEAQVDAFKKAGQQGGAPAVSGAFILGTTPAPGTPGARPAPTVGKADITTVLARLRSSIPADSKSMLTGIRAGMYKHNAFVMPPLDTFGEPELLPDVQEKVTKTLDAIATESGIHLDTLRAATVTADGNVVLAEQETKATIATSEREAKNETEKEGQDSRDTDAGTAAGAHANIDDKLLQAQGGASPAAIREQRDRLVARAHRRLAPEDLRYEREGADRQRALSMMLPLYLGAYQDVARRVAERIRKDSMPPGAKPLPPPSNAPPPAPSIGPPTAAEAWTVERWQEVRATFAALQKEAIDATAAQRAEIVRARDFARSALFEWAEKEIGDRSGWWEKFWDRVRTWGKEASDQTDAWEEARADTLGADLRGDLAFVDELASGARTQAEIEAVGALGGLSEAQQAIVKAYFAADPKTRDPLTAVAAGMRVRIVDVYRPGLVEKLNRMLLELPPSRWFDVAVVAEADGDNRVSIEARGRQFYASVDQWGTDEAKLYAALTGLTSLQRHALDLWYQHEHGSTIDAELKDELEDAELDRAQALMAGNELLADVAAIRDAIEGPGTDEEEIYRTLRLHVKDRAELEKTYLDKYKVSIDADLASDMSGEELERAKALRAGEVAKADAIGLEMAQTGKWYGGADTDAIQKIYAANRTELQDQATREGWDSAKLNQQILARNGEIDQAHRQQYKDDKGNPGPGLEASFQQHLTGPELDLALGLQQQDWARADAARLELEKRSFITDDKVVNSILQSQYERAEVGVRLDVEHQFAYRQDLAAVRGEKWDPKAQRDEMEKAIETGAKARASDYMKDLQSTYDNNYQTDPLSLMHGRGGFDALIDDHLMGSDQDRARALVAQGGYLSPAQEIKYAVQGPGTDVDVLRKMLEGRSKKQIEAIEADWDKLYPNGPKLRDRIMDDVSGRDAIDLSVALFAAETPREKLAAAKYRQKFEHETFSLGGPFASAERSALDADVARMERMVAEYESVTADPEKTDPAKADFYKWRIDQDQMAVDSAIEEHRRAADSVTDKLAMIAAVVAGAVVTALTWGAAGPFVAGALGALAAAEATILTKMAVKGAAYSQEELLVDVVSGAVDVIMALATAGIGNALMRVSKAGVPLTRLARLAASASRAKRIVAHGLKEGVEGMVGGVASGAAGVLADEKTWTQRPGDALKGVLAGSAMGGGAGLVMGGVMGGVLGGWKAPPARIDLPAVSSADAVARAAQWHAHSTKNPGASYAEFLADLNSGAITPDPTATARFHRAAQEQLAAGLPRADRKLVEGVGVTVLSDVEFERVTKSAAGQAVTVIENGKPRIVMRESAPLSALREEGIHVAQAMDPKFAEHFKLLDEAVLANWERLDLRTKLAIYAAKLDLEIDANAKVLAGLLDEIDELPPSAARGALIDQAAATRHTLENLGTRRVELFSFGPLDRLRAQLGAGPLAKELEQTPRLFSKKGPPATKAAVKQKPAKAPTAAAPDPEPAVPRAKATPAPAIDPATGNPTHWGSPPPDNKTAARRTLGPRERSPQMSRKGVQSVEQVGPEWRDRSPRGKAGRENPRGDRYRRVEVIIADPTSPKGVRSEFFEETVVRGSRPPQWVRRGSQAARAGDVAEDASLALTRRYVREAAEKGITVVTLGATLQNRSGQGFDEVYLEFHPDGRVEIVVVEVKHYTSRWAPLEDFTAVTTNLKPNLQTLTDLLTRATQAKPAMRPPALRGLDRAQLLALRKKVVGLKGSTGVVLDVRIGPTTRLGGIAQAERGGTALQKLKSRFASVRTTPLGSADVDLAGQVAAFELPEASASRLLDLHDSLVKKGRVDRVLEPVPGEKGAFTGASEKASTFRSVAADDVGRGARLDQTRIAKIADETVADLLRRVEVPGKGTKDLQVILDLSELDATARRSLRRAIGRRLARTGRASELVSRLHEE